MLVANVSLEKRKIYLTNNKGWASEDLRDICTDPLEIASVVNVYHPKRGEEGYPGYNPNFHKRQMAERMMLCGRLMDYWHTRSLKTIKDWMSWSTLKGWAAKSLLTWDKIKGKSSRFTQIGK
jgi:hypothetical protein